jgi:hypothetical protein
VKRVEFDAMIMKKALKTIKAICKKNHGADCWQCPANGHGRLCHSGELSCCAPHGWWGIELDEEKANEQAD